MLRLIEPLFELKHCAFDIVSETTIWEDELILIELLFWQPMLSVYVYVYIPAVKLLTLNDESPFYHKTEPKMLDVPLTKTE